ncbi:Phage related protein [Clostridioides difficile]|nr:Phage related protein [Clostridioides difficile]
MNEDIKLDRDFTEYEYRDDLTNDTREDLLKGIGEYWGAFYKENPHRFARDYLNIKLHMFQQIIIYMMNQSDQVCIIATRGIGKSWLLAVYACLRAILYPGSSILIASKRKKQAKLLITSKIMGDLVLKSEALRKEIKVLQNNNNEVYIEFYNGSRIEAVVSNDDARGYRANCLIIDEYRMLSLDVVDNVLLPFLNTPRQPGYLSNPEYSNLREENIEVYLSSGWYQHEWSYQRYKETIEGMLKGESSFSCNIPFICSLEHGLLTKKRIKKEMKKESMSPSSFLMEYCGVFFNESDSAFFKSSWINPCRTLDNVFYPPDNSEYLKYKNSKNKKYKLPKVKNEYRIIGVDIALAKGSNNDNSIFTLMRLIPNGDTYKRYIVHMESYNGMEAEKQCIRLKQLFEDFDADNMIIDTAGLGTTVWSYIQKENYDSERDKWYDAFTCFNEDNTVDKSMSRNAIDVVYSMKATTEINSKIALSLRDSFVNKNIYLPISSIEAKEMIYEQNKIKAEDLEGRATAEAKLLLPYIQTDALVNELITLEYETREGKIRIAEKGRNRKDRYSSVGYCDFLANLIEEREYKNKKKKKTKFLFLN